MMLIVLVAVAVMLPALAAACGGCLRADTIAAPSLAVPARHWPPVAQMATTTELAALYGREYPEARHG